MAGNTPHEALQNFLGPLNRVISCITTSQIAQSAGQDGCKLNTDYGLFVGSEATFKASSDPLVYAEISMNFRIVTVPEKDQKRLGRFKVKTTWYRYSILNHRKREMLSYQWHPGIGIDFPHLHVHSLEKCHLPTGRISIEEFVRLLVDAFDVKPKKGREWKTILGTAQERFKEFRTWG